MPRRRILLATALAAVASLAPADAHAATKPAKFSVTSVSSPPAALNRGQVFTVRGRVKNRGGGSGTALMSFSLRASAKSRKALGVGGARVRTSVRPGRTLRYTARLRLDPRLGENRSYVLVACVRTKRGAKPACRAARRRTRLRPAPAPPAPGRGAEAPATVPGRAIPVDYVDAVPDTAGARSLGDKLFPQIGNGGYDATHYDLALDYTPDTQRLAGTTTLTAVATQDLSSFSLDLSPWNVVSAVTVDGAPASFRHEATKLVIRPRGLIASGRTFKAAITYAGTQEPVIDPDGSSEGWTPTDDGAYVVNEPIGAQGWFPNNNHPTDKALYDIRVTVPEDHTVVGNGRLQSNTVANGRRTWHWREDSPMASYLTTATTGEFDFTSDVTDPARPAWFAIDSGYTPLEKLDATNKLQQSKPMLEWLEGKWGAYPFTSTGGIVDKADVGYALESQTRPNYADAVLFLEGTHLHEHAHQWFGNSVSPATWSDIWLNEGPAEFNAWWWQEEERAGEPVDVKFDRLYNVNEPDWSVPPANPTPEELFNTDAMYTRGAMVIEALRQIMTEPVWLDMLRTWEDEHAYSHGSTADFIALVKRKSDAPDARWDEFFAQWLYGTSKPTITPDNF